MQTKKSIKHVGLSMLRLFKRMDWIHYYEKKGLTSINPKIYKIIYFKYDNHFVQEFLLTKQEYQYWRSIKPKIKEK